MAFQVIPSGAKGYETLAGDLKAFSEPPGSNMEDRAKIQHAKLVNLYGDSLCEEWGGDYLKHRDRGLVLKGRDRFLKHTESRKAPWVSRIDSRLPWAPANTCFSDSPCKELWAPFEMYLSALGSIVLLRDAAPLFGLLTRELYDLKLQLVVDEMVIDAAIRHMLSPRPEWRVARMWELETFNRGN